MLGRARWALLGSLLLACGCDDAPPPAGEAPTAAVTAAPLSEGTKVVAGVTKVSFREGSVVKEDAGQVTVAIGPAPDGGERPTQTVPRARVWPLVAPSGAVLEAVKRGGYGICKLDLSGRAGALPRWYPCEVTGGAGGKLRIRDIYGKRHTLPLDQVVLPDGASREHIAAYVERERRHRAFDEAFAAAGRPLRPPSWDPAAGDAVVIHFVETSWYGGKVVEHKRDKGKVRVTWDGGTWDDRDVPLSEVAPPPTTPLPVRPESFALVRPNKPTKPWEAVKVVAVSGDEVTVKNRDERERKVARGDVLPLVVPPAPAGP